MKYQFKTITILIIAYQFKNYYYTYYANYIPIIIVLLYQKTTPFCTASEASVCKVTTTWSWTPTPPWKRNRAFLGAKADGKWGVPGKVVENLGKIMKKVESPRENHRKIMKKHERDRKHLEDPEGTVFRGQF